MPGMEVFEILEKEETGTPGPPVNGSYPGGDDQKSTPILDQPLDTDNFLVQVRELLPGADVVR